MGSFGMLMVWTVVFPFPVLVPTEHRALAHLVASPSGAACSYDAGGGACRSEDPLVADTIAGQALDHVPLLIHAWQEILILLLTRPLKSSLPVIGMLLYYTDLTTQYSTVLYRYMVPSC